MHLGIGAEEFGRLLIRDLHYLWDAHADGERRKDYRAALICAVVANANGGGNRTFQPDDFMPGGKPDPTPEEVNAKIDAILSTL